MCVKVANTAREPRPGGGQSSLSPALATAQLKFLLSPRSDPFTLSTYPLNNGRSPCRLRTSVRPIRLSRFPLPSKPSFFVNPSTSCCFCTFRCPLSSLAAGCRLPPPPPSRQLSSPPPPPLPLLSLFSLCCCYRRAPLPGAPSCTRAAHPPCGHPLGPPRPPRLTFPPSTFSQRRLCCPFLFFPPSFPTSLLL